MCPMCMASSAMLITSAGGITALAVKVKRLRRALKAATSKKVVRFRMVEHARQTPARPR